METLFDKDGRACIRLFDDWFVAYRKAQHLGWLSHGGAVYNNNGEHIGWYSHDVLQDETGKRVADKRGSVLPGMAGIPGRPGLRGFSGIRHGQHGITSAWSEKTFEEFFGVA